MKPTKTYTLDAAQFIRVEDAADELRRIDAEIDRTMGDLWRLWNERKRLREHAKEPF